MLGIPRIIAGEEIGCCGISWPPSIHVAVKKIVSCTFYDVISLGLRMKEGVLLRLGC